MGKQIQPQGKASAALTHSGVKKVDTKRTHTAREGKASNKLFVLSGTLAEALPKHAFERCRHFFFFLYAIRALEYVNNVVQKRPAVSALKGFKAKATDQIDDGFRLDAPAYNVFGRDDEQVIDLPTTQFSDIDAAHFCNLGIDPGFVAGLDLSHPVVQGLYAELKAFAGNTRWMPQLVNIGPDRRIDILHAKLAAEFLQDGNAICSRTRIVRYITDAQASLLAYVVTKRKQKKRGVAACTQCYLAGYADDTFADRIFSALSGASVGWCRAVNLPDAEKLLIAYG